MRMVLQGLVQDSTSFMIAPGNSQNPGDRLFVGRNLDAAQIESQLGNQLDMEEQASARVSGQVQGVFYRSETAKAAQNLGVAGWVRNHRMVAWKRCLKVRRLQ